MSVKRVANLLFPVFIVVTLMLVGLSTLAAMPAKAWAGEEVISYELNDSYGDGWNGNSISIMDTADGSTVASLTIDYGSHEEGTVSLTLGHVYQFVWTQGTWQSECSFTFNCGNKNILEGGGDGRNNGDVLLTYAAGYGAYTSYDLWVSEIQVANSNAADVLGDGTVSYDAETRTLTLDNCACVRNGGESAMSSLIYASDAEGPITLNLKGNNVLEGGPGDQYGIYTHADVTITGDGSLTVVGGGSNGGSANSVGVYSMGTITLDGSFTGTVVARGAATAGQSTGFSGPNVIVNGGTLIAEGGVGVDGDSIGLQAGTSLSVTDGTVIAQGGPVSRGNSSGVTLGDSASINVSGGTVLIQGGSTSSTSGHSRGINCVNGGAATFSGGAAVVRAGAIGTGSNRYSHANRDAFRNCSHTNTGMTAVSVGYSIWGTFTTGSSARKTIGFACAPSSWNNLGGSSSSSLPDEITLSNDSYFINTTASSPIAALSSLDTNGYEILLVNLFEGDPDNWAAGLVLSNSGDVSLTGSGSVVAVGGMTSSTENSHGLRVAGNLSVAGPEVIGVAGQANNDSGGIRCASGNLSVSSGKAIGVGSDSTGNSRDSYGLSINQDVAVSETGSVVGVGGITASPDTYSYGIKAQGITMQGNASVLGAGGSSSASGVHSYGIDAVSIETLGGAIAGVGGDHAAGSVGMDECAVIARRDTNLIAVGGNQQTDFAYGIGGLTEGSAFEGSATLAGATSAFGSPEGTLLLGNTGTAFGCTDFAGTVEKTAIESGAALSTLSGYKHIKIDTPPTPLASGMCGTCYWEITPDKVLMVYPGELDPALDNYMPWYPKNSSSWQLSDIERVVAVSRGEQKVVAPSNSKYIFGMLEHAKTMDLSGLDTSHAQDMSFMFASNSSLETIDVSMLDTSNATSMQSMFHACPNLGSLDLSSHDLTNVTSTRNMFSGCTSLGSVDMPDTGGAHIADASGMFSNCAALESLDLSALDLSSVTDASGMFRDCTSLASLGLPGQGMSNVKNVSNLFSGCTSLATIDLSAFDMTNVTRFGGLFAECSSLESLKLGSACKLSSDAALPAPPTAHPYTGKWVREEGGEPLSAAELMGAYDGATMAGTYVWQQIVPRTSDELEQLIITAITTAPYKDVGSVKVSVDGSDVYTVDTWVTQEAKDTLTSAIATAQVVAANGQATQAQIDYAYIDLEAAMANYVPQWGTKERELVEAATWSRLWELLQDNGSRIKLTADVKYGTGGGEHESDALVVPAGFLVSLDLNGHIVDRDLGQAAEAVDGGSVITVAGELTITDSAPDAAHNPSLTFAHPLDAENIIAVTGGAITGGYAVTQYESDSQRCYGGGGVLVERNAHLVMTGGSICGNRATEGSSDGAGGGVAVKPNGVFDMSGTAAVCGNVCEGDGGGVWLESATLNMDGDASIYGNHAISQRGGGVSAQRSNVTMKGNSNITGNKVDGGVNGWGGGVDFYMLCNLTMEDNAAITSNVASGRGGGLCVTSWLMLTQVITMKDNATISNNTAGDFGGGAYIHAGAELNMSGESSITYNKAGSDGGGVSTYSGAQLNMSGEAAITNNVSSDSGGGVNLDGGSQMSMSGGTISGNSAQYVGGGVYVSSDTPSFRICGAVEIDGNEIVDGNGEHVRESNLHGAAGSGSSMAAPITVTGALDEGCAIGISQWGVPGEDAPVDAVSGFADNNPDVDPRSMFTSDTVDYLVIVGADGEPKLALPECLGVWVGGKRVTALNASDVFSDGTVSYDQANKTLTLNGYQFDGYGEMTHHAALATTVENLTVNLVGDNKIVESGWFNWDAGTDCFGIWAENGLNITGSGTLESWAYYMNTSGTTGAGIYVASGSLTLGEEFTGELWAHANRGIGVMAAGDVLVGGGKVKFAGETRAVQAGSVSIGKDLAVFGSGDADAVSGDVLAANNGESPLDITELVGEACKSVWTEPLESYDLWVNGERFNTVDLTIACGEGTAVFDPDAETPTLTLTNATIAGYAADSDVSACIYSELPDLRIKVVGQNLIKPTESDVDGVGSTDGCNIAVVSDAEETGSLKLENVNYGFNIGGTIEVAGNLETASAAGGTNVPDGAITLAPGWNYTKGTSLTQSGSVVIERVFTVTFDGNGHGGVLATMQVPKGKSLNDVAEALSDEARDELEAKLSCEVSDGGKTYLVSGYYANPDGSGFVNWDLSIHADLTVYAQWIECVTLVEVSVEPPVCGTVTETSKNSEGYWDFSTQTNKPVGSVTGPNYALAENDSVWYAGWCAGTAASIFADPESLAPYVGKFTGGDSYALLGDVQALEGYAFSKDVVVKVNGVECETFAFNDILGYRNYIEFAVDVTAVHDLEETPEVPATCTEGGFEAYWTCSGCGKTFSDAAGTQEVSAPVPIEALGHLWGDWEIVTEPTAETDGLARRVCLHDPSHVGERVIPAGKNVQWKRLAGNTRYDTMAEIVKEGFDRSSWAVVATGANFPDALSASALAGYKNCPVVLTAQGSLSAQARAELERLGVKNVYIMGGTVAISEKVERQVKALNGGIKVTRIAGSNRMDTSVQVMNVVKGKSDTVIVATGYGYADALSIGPWSYAAKAPIVLTKSDGTLTAAEVKAIKAAGYKKYVIVGGTGVVKNSVKTQLSGLKFVGRLGGKNRYETSKLIVEFLLKNGLTAQTPAVATGENFPDALAGAAMQGSTRSVIVLVKNENSPSLKAITDNAASIQSGYVLGGQNVVPDSLVAHIQSLVVEEITASTMSSSDVYLSAAHAAFG